MIFYRMIGNVANTKKTVEKKLIIVTIREKNALKWEHKSNYKGKQAGAELGQA